MQESASQPHLSTRDRAPEGAPAPADAAPVDFSDLQRRILRLAQRVEDRTWLAAEQSARELGESLLPAAPPETRPTGASRDFLLHTAQLLGRVGPLRARLGELERAAVLAERPADRSKLLRAQHLVELADRMMREARSSANHQIAMLPAWEAMLEQAGRWHAELADAARKRQRRQAETNRLRELFCQLLAGGRIRLEAATELAGMILREVDESPQPEVVQPTHFDPAVVAATHAVNVAHVAGRLASLDANGRAQRLGVVVGALFMDVGMLKAAPDVLRSARPLDDLRRADVERHPIESSAAVERIAGFDERLAFAIAAHHEREDGRGYPSGLQGSAIPPIAKLLAVADTYVALQSRRAHRPGAAPHIAFAQTLALAESGGLDASVARFLLSLSMYPVGTVVELATGELAEVVAPQNALEDPPLAALPFVKLLVDRQGAVVAAPIYRNLAARPECQILRTLTPEEAFARTVEA